MFLAGTGTRFEPGFTHQLVRPGTKAEVYKTWRGMPTQIVLNRPGQVTVTLLRQETFLLSAAFGPPNAKEPTPIPWSIGKYVEDPARFFELLGIGKPASGEPHPASQVNLFCNGVV